MAWRSTKKRGEIWGIVAQELGLNVDSHAGFLSSLQISGKIGEVLVTAYLYTESHGKSSTTYCCVDAVIPTALPSGMTVFREGLFQRLGKALGGEDIQVGDEDLDQALIIKGHEPHEIGALLCAPEVKRRLLKGVEEYKSLRIDENTVSIKETGHLASPVHLSERIINCANLARAIYEATSPAVEVGSSRADFDDMEEYIAPSPTNPW